MVRTIISDRSWEQIQSFIPVLSIYETDRLRDSIEGMLWRLRTGAPWRDLPLELGNWKTVYNRFNDWCKRGVWDKFFEACKGELDNEWNFIDGTYIRAHQHAAGGVEKIESKTIGPSRGGNTTKVHMLVDAFGNPIAFEITAGSVHDAAKASDLLEHSEAETSLQTRATTPIP